MTEDSLPSSLDDRERVSTASKYWQLGPPACSSLLDGALTGVNPEPRAIIMVDLFVRCGEMTEAFVQKRMGKSNFHYIGMCETQEEILYVQNFLQEFLAESYETGSPTPTGEKIEQTMSQDLMEPMPPHPRLNLLVPGPGHCFDSDLFFSFFFILSQVD